MYDLLFLFIFIFIVINHIITLKQTHFFFAYFLEHALLSLTGKKNLRSVWLRGVQYWPYLYSVLNIYTL